MRIAVLAPLIEPVPPPLYGGTERVVSALAEGLVARGHEVTLFASGDSTTSAALVSAWPRGLRLDPAVTEYPPVELAHVADVYERAAEFDIIHNHQGVLAFPFARHVLTPTVTTVHGRLDHAYLRAPLQRFLDHPLVSISDSQRAPHPDGRWISTVYNGVEVSRFHFRPEPGAYLVFLGRIHPEKRPDRAIEIAGRAGMRLVIAAKVDPADRDYYETEIAPLIRRSPHVEFVGEVNDEEKDALLGGAYAYLFPIDWPEPFGLTMVEAMATGTPVIAWRNGSVPEIVEDGVTGFIRDSMDGMVEAVGQVEAIDRAVCRAHADRRFGTAQMVAGYERAYRRLLSLPRHRAARSVVRGIRHPRGPAQQAFGEGRPA